MKNQKSLNAESSAYKKWLLFNTLGLFIILTASMLAPAFPFYWNSFSKYIFNILAAALIVLYIIFRWGEKRTEVRLCALFCIWALLSRLLNGDTRLTDGGCVFNIAVSCMFFPLCMLLDEKKRSLLLDIVSLLACLFFTFGAVIGIYTAVTQKLVINPFSQWYFCEIGYNRLYMYDQNPNTVGNWMFICLALLVYQFAKRKNLWLRIPAVLMFIIDFTAAAISDSRNAMLGISAGAAAAALLFSLKLLKIKKLRLKVLTACLIALAVLPLTYMSFSQVKYAVSIASEHYRIRETAAALPSEEPGADAAPAGTEPSAESPAEAEPDVFKDQDRGFSDSGRMTLYKSALYSIKRDPARLLRGSLSSETMTFTNEYIPNTGYEHYHNSALHALEFTGLPGFILVIAFLVLLFIRAFRLFFTEDGRATTAVKLLVASLPGFYIYNMLESSIFFNMDFKSIVFFIIAGAVTAYSYEICPPKKKNKKA